MITMHKDDKIMSLMRSWPPGAVFTSEWLIHEKGYSRGLLQQYRKSGWIQLVGKGAYRRVEFDENGKLIPLHWSGGVYALQALSKSGMQVHVAARTALELKGMSHYLNLSGKETVWLFTKTGYRVPTWFKNFDWGAKIKLHSTKLFSKSLPDTFSTKDWGAFVSRTSCPERAMMEALELCPQGESLGHAKQLMENMAGIRPQVAMQLLEACTSIKVKRLFLALADVCNHDWLNKINIDKIDLGVGDRVLESGQGFHSKFKISVPKEGNMG